VEAFLAGLLAGLGVAVPLGAVGVLLVQEGVTRGWRPAAAGATGVALVDGGYALVAVVAGTAVSSALAGRERAIQVVGAVVLLAVVARGLVGLRRRDADAAALGEPPSAQVLRRFVALTAVNPLTAVYFVALTASLGSRVSGPAAGAAFVAGVFLASWAWQLVLATAGAAGGSRMPTWARTATSLTGYAVVTGYAVHLALGG
jgi:arginine exporter protein ArgO